MRLNVVHAKGRIFVDVPVEIGLPDEPTLEDLIEVLPVAAAPPGHPIRRAISQVSRSP